LAVVTDDARLQEVLREERDRIYSHGTAVGASTFANESRRLSGWEGLAGRLLGSFF
jgi:hypothetical protein